MTLDQLSIPDCIAAVAALGTASYALVDSSKAFWGGASNHGFGNIARVLTKLYPANTGKRDFSTPLTLASVLGTLKSSWLNGVPLADQKAIAKSLVKLRLDESNAAHLAHATGVDAAILASVAKKIATGESMTQQEKDVFGRFDLILTAILDEGYQQADQQYRNTARTWAAAVSVVLALVGGWVVNKGSLSEHQDILTAFLVGLLAVPLAPIAKDLSSALSAGVKAMQAFRK